METAQRKLLLIAEDPDLAEVAAIGLRMWNGWEPVIATEMSPAIAHAQDPSMAAMVYIAVRSTTHHANVRALQALSEIVRVPLFVITPDREIADQYRCLGVEVVCTPFDPLQMWQGVPMPQPARNAIPPLQ